MNKLSSYLRRNWAWYLAVALVGVISTSIAGAILGKTKEEEKIDIFLVAETIDYPSWNEKLNETKPSYLKELNYRFMTPSDSYFSSVLSTYGDVDTDLFFFPKSTLDSVKCSSLMLALDEAKTKNIFGDSLTFYEDEGVKYGIKIAPTGFAGSEDFYACFRSTSLHLGELNSSSLDGDISIVRSFL